MKKLLFKTYEGVKIYNDEKQLWILDINGINELGKGCQYYKYPHLVKDKDVVIFTSKENAEDYWLLNVPCLSINDLIEFENSFRFMEVSYWINKLKELVKLKKKLK